MATILIIDDGPLMRRTIRRALTNAHHDAVEAANGRDGLRLFRIHRPALIITDLLMPDHEGIETILEIRREIAGIPVIAISGADFSSYLNMAKSLGADATLTKPFRPAELIETVDRLLGAPDRP